MEQKELLELLKQKEGPKLEFKQEMYQIQKGDENRDFQKHEMIRDILALANGNPSHAWAEGHLIIGATDHFVNDRRELIGVTPQDNLESQIIQIVNDACNPKLSHLSCEYIDVDGVTLLVITIPRTPYIIETTKPLKTKGKRGEDGRIKEQEYSEHVVFVRLGESVTLHTG